MGLALRFLSAWVGLGLISLAGSAGAQTTVPVLPDAAYPTVSPSLTILPEAATVPALRLRPVSVDPYEPIGIRRGGMIFYPALEVGALASSNATQTPSQAKSGVGLRLRPSLRFESDWVRHSWEGRASGDITEFLEKGISSDASVDAESRFRLDIRHNTQAEFTGGYHLSQTGSANSEVPDTAIGKRIDHNISAGIGVLHEFGPLEARMRLGIARQIYEDVDLQGGGKEDNGDRTYTAPSAGLRLTYIDPPALKPFAEIVYEPRLHDRKLDRNGLARDSHGLKGAIGVVLERGPIWSGEAAIVYAMRDYRDNSLATTSAVGINGNLTWRPTELTSLLLTLDTTLNESSSATVSGSKTYSANLDVAHALRDNIDIVGGVGLSATQYPQDTEDTYTTKLELEWQLRPELAWTAGYDGTWFKGIAASDDYNEQRLSIGMVLQR